MGVSDLLINNGELGMGTKVLGLASMDLSWGARQSSNGTRVLDPGLALMDLDGPDPSPGLLSRV